MNYFLRTAKRILKKILGLVDSMVMDFAATTRPTAGLYYLIKGNFSREQQSVLAGKLIYRKSTRDPRINTSLLRRNIHRLEKGLLMQPRRVPFGLNYIGETVRAYALAVRAETDVVELAWARDVLQEYMRISPAHPVIEPLRQIVRDSAEFPPSIDTENRRVPYLRNGSDTPDISYEEFLKLVRFRRSVRWYLPDKVPRQMIEKAVEAASWSPTACNRQPYEFRVFDDKELVSKLIQLPMGTTGFSHQVPVVVVVLGKQRNYFSERDRHAIYVDGSLAIMSFVYALEVQGLSSCCINWPDIEDRERRMAEFLELAPDERPIMLVALGYPDPDGLVANSTKKAVSTLCKFNFESP